MTSLIVIIGIFLAESKKMIHSLSEDVYGEFTETEPTYEDNYESWKDAIQLWDQELAYEYGDVIFFPVQIKKNSRLPKSFLNSMIQNQNL